MELSFTHLVSLLFPGYFKLDSDFFYLQDLYDFNLSANIIRELNAVRTERKRSTNRFSDVTVIKADGKQVTAMEQDAANIFGYVMGINILDLSDNFLELGGDSIQASKIVLYINEQYHMNISSSDLLRNNKLQNFMDFLKESLAQHEAVLFKHQISGSTHRILYTASYEQMDIYAAEQLNPSTSAYNIISVLQIHGNLIYERLAESFQRIVKRHESLRTSFHVFDGSIVQCIHDWTKVDVIHKKICVGDLDREISTMNTPFDLETAPLLRVGIYEISNHKCYLVCVIHHMIADGDSLKILIEEFKAFYRGETLQDNTMQYHDYSEVEYAKQQTNQKEKEKFWRSCLGDVNAYNKLFEAVASDSNGTAGVVSVAQVLSSEDSRILADISQKNGITLFVTLISAFFILLYRCTGKEDIIVGTPISLRFTGKFQHIIGNFVNVIPVRLKVQGKEKAEGLFQRTKEYMLEVSHNADYRLNDILKEAGGYSRDSMFDVVFSMQNYEKTEVEIEGCQISSYSVKTEHPKYNMLLYVDDFEECIKFHMECNSLAISQKTAQIMMDKYVLILKNFCSNSNKEINSLLEAEQYEGSQSSNTNLDDFNFN